MARARKYGTPLVAALVAACLVGPIRGADEAGAGATPRLTTRTVTIPAAAFTAIDSNADYTSSRRP